MGRGGEGEEERQEVGRWGGEVEEVRGEAVRG